MLSINSSKYIPAAAVCEMASDAVHGIVEHAHLVMCTRIRTKDVSILPFLEREESLKNSTVSNFDFSNLH